MNRDRRRLLRLLGHAPLWLAVASGTSVVLGRALAGRDRDGRRARRPPPTDLPPIPWIGHC